MQKLLLVLFFVLGFSLFFVSYSKSSGVDCVKLTSDLCSAAGGGSPCSGNCGMELVCPLGPACGGDCAVHPLGNTCYNNYGAWSYCFDDKCPDTSTVASQYNGANCRVDDGSGQGTAVRTGVYDQNQGKCISCNGNVENAVWGDTSNINTQSGLGTQDFKCETACNNGLNSLVDEKSPGASIGTCDQTGATYFQDFINSDNSSCGLHDDTTKCDSSDSGCTASSQCNGLAPGSISSSGYCIDSSRSNNYLDSGTTCNYIDCNSKDTGYSDTNNNVGSRQCSSYTSYSTYSNANQRRDYSPIPGGNGCGCDVTYDSYITSVTVKGNSSGNVGVNGNENLTAEISIINLGSTPSSNWFVGVEFWNVSDYNNPNATKDPSGRVDAYLNRTSNGGFNYAFNYSTLQYDRKPFNKTGCTLVNDPNGNGIFDPLESITVDCWAPAGYWPPSLGKNRTMMWIHERDTGIDVNADGVNTWWYDALSQSYPNDTQNQNDVQKPDPIKIIISGNIYGRGLNIVSENNIDVLTSWLLLPQFPTKGQQVSLILNATDNSTGLPLTPDDGFSPVFQIGNGIPVAFSYLPDSYSGIGPFYMVNFSLVSDNFPIRVSAFQKFPYWVMNGIISQGSNNLNKTQISYDDATDHLTITSFPSIVTDPTLSVYATVRSPTDFSEIQHIPMQKIVSGSTTSYLNDSIFNTGPKFFLEVLANGQQSFGGTYLSRGITPPNIRLNVSPQNIYDLTESFTFKNETQFIINNTGTLDINDIKISANPQSANFTISPTLIALPVGQSITVKVTFDVFEYAINGNISINYSAGTKVINVPLEIVVNNTTALTMSDISFNAIKDVSFDRQFQVQNKRNIPVGFESVKILDYTDLSKEISDINGTPGTTIPPSGTGYFKIDGKISTAGLYNYWVEVFTTEGTRFAHLTLNVTPGDPALLLKIQNLNTLTNTLLITCPPAATSKNTLQDCNDLTTIKTLTSQATSSYNQGDLTSASDYYNQAQTKYNSLSATVVCEKNGCGIPLIYFVVIGVIAVVVVILFFAMKSEGPKESEGEGGEREDETYEELPEV